MAKAMSSVSAPSPSAMEDGERGEEIIRRVRDTLRHSGTEEDMIPNFVERIRAAQSDEELDDIVMEQACVMVRRVRREMAEEKAAEKNASGSRDG